MSLLTCLYLLTALVPISEIGLALCKRAKQESTQTEDRGSLRLLWLVIALSLGAAISLRGLHRFALPLSPTHQYVVAITLLAVGLVLRWTAILTLGRFFTVDVAIHSDHRLVDTGLYGVVRHPSYTGMLLTFLGLGVSFGNWVSFVLLVLPVTLALYRRILTEEQALLKALGAPYEDYCARTSRLIPGLL